MERAHSENVAARSGTPSTDVPTCKASNDRLLTPSHLPYRKIFPKMQKLFLVYSEYSFRLLEIISCRGVFACCSENNRFLLILD